MQNYTSQKGMISASIAVEVAIGRKWSNTSSPSGGPYRDAGGEIYALAQDSLFFPKDHRVLELS